MPADCTLVVGTTADYIEEIRGRFPGRAVFITAPGERKPAREPKPGPDEELLADLEDSAGVIAALDPFLRLHGRQAAAIACFDCESLDLAARIANHFELAFPSVEAVAACRSKLRAKQLWQRAGVGCPEAALVSDLSEVLAFFERSGKSIVLKPVSGSGSELVFKCTSQRDCHESLSILRQRLSGHSNRRMYGIGADAAMGANCRRQFLAERFIDGPEFSCDAILDEEGLRIIRTAAKHHAADQPAGTTLAYVVPGKLPAGLATTQLESQLAAAARALGLRRALFMADFIVRDGRACLLELTPRPGGDCLPPLIRASCGLDMLGLALDVAEGKPADVPPPDRWERLVGMRFFAASAGIFRRVRTHLEDPILGVRSVVVKATPGSRITLPPEDYDSRILGHVLFKPEAGRSIPDQCADIGSRISVEMDPDG